MRNNALHISQAKYYAIWKFSNFSNFIILKLCHVKIMSPVHNTDYYALFGTICRGCEFPIEAGDMFLEALGYTWHDTCFVCSVSIYFWIKGAHVANSSLSPKWK